MSSSTRVIGEVGRNLRPRVVILLRERLFCGNSEEGGR